MYAFLNNDNDSHYMLKIEMRQARWLVLATMALVVAACGPSSDGSTEDLEIVATTTILGDVVAEIVGELATVEVLMPIGADPHDFSPSSQQVALINRADLVVANGLDLEEGLEDVLDSAAEDGVAVVYVAESVTPLPEDDQTGPEEEGNHDHGGEDPHFWLDPIRMAEASGEIGRVLQEIDPSGTWADSATRYAQDLTETDQQVERILLERPEEGRKLVTNHDSLDYFADRYGFEVIGVVVPGGSTLGDPSSEELAGLVAAIEAESVPAIFAETTESDTLAEAVAAEVGFDVEVVDLYTGSLGEEGSGAETYTDMLLTNAQLIADALA